MNDKENVMDEERSLDEAWAEVEAGLPDGWELSQVARFLSGWWALAFGPRPVKGPCECCGQQRHDQRLTANGQGPTPTLALQGLAAKLRNPLP